MKMKPQFAHRKGGPASAARQSKSEPTRGMAGPAHPWLAALLAGAWLALSHSVALGHVLLALLMALGLPRLLRGFLGHAAGPVSLVGALRLSGVVVWDVVVACVVVSKWVLGPVSAMRPAWLWVPLACDHPRVNALFACIITTTPGTVACVVDEQRGRILVHALHCDDAPAMTQAMKQRYEAPLMKIFAQTPRQAGLMGDGI